MNKDRRKIELETRLSTERHCVAFGVLSSAILQFVIVEKINPKEIDTGMFKFRIDFKHGGIRFDIPLPFVNGSLPNIVSVYNNEMIKFLAVYMKSGQKINVVYNRRVFVIAKNEMFVGVSFVRRLTPKEFNDLINLRNNLLEKSDIA